MMLPSDVPIYKVSIVMLGDSGVGKSALMSRFVSGEYNPNAPTTVGFSRGYRKISVQGMSLHLDILDTGGQERFRAITPQYYRKAAGVLLVYDITNQKTFDSLEDWIDKIRDIASANVTIMVVGNKKDLQDRRVVSFDVGKAFATRKSVSFIETTAQDVDSIEDAFVNTAIEIRDKINHGLLRNESHGIKLLECARSIEPSVAADESLPVLANDACPQKQSQCC